MINTPAFESLERYIRLKNAITDIELGGGTAPYEWMLPYLYAAKKREKQFMETCKEAWIEQMEAGK